MYRAIDKKDAALTVVKVVLSVEKFTKGHLSII